MHFSYLGWYRWVEKRRNRNERSNAFQCMRTICVCRRHCYIDSLPIGTHSCLSIVLLFFLNFFFIVIVYAKAQDTQIARS